MLSSLSKGYGSWTAGQVDPYYGEKYGADNVLPDIDLGSHRHGITQRSGRSTAMSWAGTRPLSRQNTEGSVALPKTYSTRKGALQLFVGPDVEPEEKTNQPLKPMYSQLRRQFTKQELVDLSLKLGTIERFTKSVLQYGDEEYDHEQTSVSDEKNKAFLKFLHSIDAGRIDIDSHVQPGGDLTSYLRDLKSSASSHYYSDGSSYMPKSRESQELQAILRGLDSNWPLSFKQDSFSDAPSSGQFTRPVSRGPSPGPPSTPRSTYQVLSSRKLAASIKSGSYLGRPSSTVSDLDRDDADFEFLPVTRAVISQKSLSAPDLLNPEDLLTGRRGLGFRSVTNSSIGEETENESVTDSYFEFGKRKRASKRPDLAYQGRNAHKGEGQHIDVKVKGKGDGLDGESQFMDSIVEVVETVSNEAADTGVVVDDDESVDWEEKVAEIERQRGKLLSERTSLEPNIIKNSDYFDPSPIEVSLQQSVKYPETDITCTRNDSPHSCRSSVSSASSKTSWREAGKLSIVSVQEYRSSSPSLKTQESRTHTPLSRTHTPLSRQSRKRLTPSNSHAQNSDSRSASITGVEIVGRDIVDIANEIDANENIDSYGLDEFQAHPIYEEQELDEELNERENDFTTQGQIHIDIGYSNDEISNGIESKDNVDDYLDIPDQAIIIEAENEEEPLDSPTDQKSFFTESEDETGWPGKEAADVLQSDESEEKVIIEEAVTTISYDDAQQLDSTQDNAEAVLDHIESEPVVDQANNDTATDVITTEETVDIVTEPTLQEVDIKVEIKVVAESEKAPENVEVVRQENLVGKVEEDSVLEDSASNRGKSSKSGEQGEVHFEAGLQALGTLLSDSLSDKGDKSAAGDNLSRPASAKLSRPSSGKLSRPSSGKISRPQSGKLSRPASGKLSRPASARGSPVVRPASPVEQNQNTTLDQQTSLEGDVTGSQIVDKTVDTLLEEQSKNIDSKQTDENLSKTDKDSMKTVSEQESKGGRPLGRQKALKMKKPVQQRQRPGKAAKQAEPEKTSVHGGYIPQEDTAKDTDNMKIEVQDVVPEIKIEPDTSQTVGVDEEAVIEEAQDVALGVSSDADAHSIVSELDALGLRVPVKHKKKAAKEKEKVMIPTHLEEVLSRQPTRSYEALEADLEKMTELVDESLSGPTLAAVGEGLTEEELELAKQILEKKIRAATDKLDDKEKKPIKKKAAVKPGKKGKGRAKTPVDTRTDEEREQDEIKERQRLEKLKRDMEAKELQRKIAERKLLLKAQTDAASARSLEIQAEMERFQKEADEIQEAEDQARDAMADLRKRQREERDTRRKADLERKKQEAISRREREKRQMEENKKKELEMLEKIADAEMRRRLREEEERKMCEEERLAQERLEEELREAQRQAEEEEERMKELERQAEEEAMQRLIEEREAAERHRRRLQEEKEAMEEAERVKEEYLRQEELRLLEEKQKLEADEIERREKEKLRLVELRRLEEEARARMQEELEKRRQEALARREFNIEHRQNSDRLKHGQGITRAWTFSYFVRWPRDSYERLMGEVDPKKKRFMPRPKKKAPPPVEEAEKPPENAAPN